MIRNASVDDLPVLREIERAAGEPFRAIGMAAVADDEPPTIAELTTFQRAGHAWVATDAEDRPIAYLLVAIIDGHAHIEQVSVHTGHAGQGIGRRLVEHVDTWAASRGLAGLTLTTYADVPWNGPYYVRLGFRVLADAELTAGLRAVRTHEAAKGLDAWPRVAMHRALQSSGPSSGQSSGHSPVTLR